MNAVLDAADMNATGPADESAPEASRPLHRCAECLASFTPKQATQLFCSIEHKRAYNNRWLKRGAVLAPLQAAARITRGGHRGDRVTGARARQDAERLLQRWKVEDEKAGRMSAVEYMAARYRLGPIKAP